MATIKFFIVGKSESSTIYVRFTHGRKYDFKRATHQQIKPKHWNSEKQRVRNVIEEKNKDKINEYLDILRAFLVKQFLNDYSNGVLISGDWLEGQIKANSKQEDETDLSLLSNYCEYFISNLPTKKNHTKGSGSLGVSKRTIEKYKNVVKKLNDFQSDTKKKFQLTDINLKFETDFIKYLSTVEKLSDNTIGRTITFVKTICNDARDNGLKVNPQLARIKGFKSKTKFITLSEEEISKIYNYDFGEHPFLENARDWLIVGLYSGQRVSDFISFTKETIKGDFLEFTQMKTGTKTIVPLHGYVSSIVKKYDGHFPRKISEQRFNDYIKRVCQEVGLNQLVEGALINPETKRKEVGEFPKYKLVTSHICRRSFATNHFGKLPTPVLMSITGHTSEKMFLNYISKSPIDDAKLLKDYWEAMEYIERTNKSPLKVTKSQA